MKNVWCWHLLWHQEFIFHCTSALLFHVNELNVQITYNVILLIRVHLRVYYMCWYDNFYLFTWTLVRILYHADRVSYTRLEKSCCHLFVPPAWPTSVVIVASSVATATTSAPASEAAAPVAPSAVCTAYAKRFCVLFSFFSPIWPWNYSVRNFIA